MHLQIVYTNALIVNLNQHQKYDLKGYGVVRRSCYKFQVFGYNSQLIHLHTYNNSMAGSRKCQCQAGDGRELQFITSSPSSYIIDKCITKYYSIK